MSAKSLRDELQQLHSEITQTLAGSSEQILDSSKAKVEELSKQLRSALEDVSQTLATQEQYAQRMVTDRPLTTLASAFALGLAIGLMLRSA